MPSFDVYEPGWPCWVDLMTPDVAAAEAFYSSVFGWQAEPGYDDEGTRIYTNFTLDGRNVCGMGGQPPEMAGAPAIWSTYICTADAEAVTAAVEAAGGAVMMPPMAIMEVGTMAILADPTGAAFSIWQPGEHKGAGVANEPNTWSWNELNTRDVDTARDFYGKVFGWTYDSQEMPDGSYDVIKGGDHGGLGGIALLPADTPDEVPNHWLTYFGTTDVDGLAAAITGAGGQVTVGPMEIPGVGRFAMFLDPQGGAFASLQPPA